MQINVLDHGFVKLLNISGPVRRPDRPYDADSIDPALTARVSFNKLNEERPVEKDLALVSYLLNHKHNTPIEMIEVWVEMKLPIFVARQFVRHRTACINEVSGRYVTLPEEWYIPETVGGKAVKAKQGQEDNLTEHVQEQFRFFLNEHCKHGYAEYLRALNSGVAPEHARLFLSVNHYTHWVWKQDLHNMLHFLRLRIDSHAQIEAQKYGRAIKELLLNTIPGLVSLSGI